MTETKRRVVRRALLHNYPPAAVRFLPLPAPFSPGAPAPKPDNPQLQVVVPCQRCCAEPIIRDPSPRSVPRPASMRWRRSCGSRATPSLVPNPPRPPGRSAPSACLTPSPEAAKDSRAPRAAAVAPPVPTVRARRASPPFPMRAEGVSDPSYAPAADRRPLVFFAFLAPTAAGAVAATTTIAEGGGAATALTATRAAVVGRAAAGTRATPAAAVAAAALAAPADFVAGIATVASIASSSGVASSTGISSVITAAAAAAAVGAGAAIGAVAAASLGLTDVAKLMIGAAAAGAATAAGTAVADFTGVAIALAPAAARETVPSEMVGTVGTVTTFTTAGAFGALNGGGGGMGGGEIFRTVPRADRISIPYDLYLRYPT